MLFGRVPFIADPDLAGGCGIKITLTQQRLAFVVRNPARNVAVMQRRARLTGNTAPPAYLVYPFA